MPRDVWQCAKGFLHDIGDWLGERGSVVPLHETMSLNVWRSIVLPAIQPVSCLKIEFQYNLKRFFKLFGVLMASEGLNNSGLMNVCS